MAASASSTSRRALLAGLTTTPLTIGPVTAAIAAVRAEHEDAQLIALEAEFEAAYATETAKFAALSTHCSQTEWDDASDYQQEVTKPIVERVAALRAKDLRGARLKVRAILWLEGIPSTASDIERFLPSQYFSENMQLALYRDLLAMGQGA